MKKTFLSLTIIFFSTAIAQAQWTSSGTNIVNNNTGYVGVNTNLIVSGTTTLGGAVVLNTTLGVSGATTFSNTVSSNSSFISTNGSGFQLNRPAGNTRDITWQSGGLARWVMRVDAIAENGSNTGSDFNLIGRDDTGTSLGTYLFVKRNNGNIGIGTTNPLNKLEVNGTGRFMGSDPNATTGTGVEIFYYPTNGGYFQAYDRNANTFLPVNIQGSSINFSNSGVASSSPSLVIRGGNIGIGTTDGTNWQLATSAYKLAVNGSVIANSITVKPTANWPDYVFTKGFNLKPLTELKTYIDLNHHLPEMPSAQQVASAGLNLGEMNGLLAQKVEELTLYLIDKDKELKRQQLEINQQQVQIDQLKQQLNVLIKSLKTKS